MPRAKEMLSRLSTAFRKDEDSNNYKVLSVIAEEFDEIEQVIEQLRNSRFVEIATGKSLDYIAKLFNLTRKSEETDEEIRGRLQVELQKYMNYGTLNDILNVIKYFTGLEDKDIKIVEAPDAILGYGQGSFGNNVFTSPKATLRAELLEEPALQLNLKAFYNAIEAVKAAGVYFQQDETVLWFILPQARTFGESETTWLITTPLGFGYDKFGEKQYGGYMLVVGDALSQVNIWLENNDVVSTSSPDYVEVKRLSYQGAATFTNITAHAFPEFGGTGYVKIEYRVNRGSWTLIDEQQITGDLTINKTLNVQLSESDTADFRLLLKANFEMVGNDTFRVDGTA